jgi:peptide/nickel transport system substrate-binding protein
MVLRLRLVTAFFGLSAVMASSGAALAQKHGGILKQYMTDSPASMSIHEESTVVAERPMMAVFNNLVMFDQHVAQNSLDSIVPDLATDWSWGRGRRPADLSPAPGRQMA